MVHKRNGKARMKQDTTPESGKSREDQRRILILGASGFIGARLKSLLEADPEMTEKRFAVEGFSSLLCNLLDYSSASTSLMPGSQDIIIMCSSVPRLKEDSYASMMRNILMADNLARIVESGHPAQLVFLSSVDVYGNTDAVRLSESTPPNPAGYYAVSKLASELILKEACSASGTLFAVLRLPGIYGPGDYGRSTLNLLFSSAAEKGRITIFGDGSDERDFVYSDDLAGIIKMAILRKVSGVINIATGESHTVREIAKLVSGSFQLKVEITADPSTEKKPLILRFDNSLMRKLLGNVKMTRLEDGIKKYSQYFRQVKKKDG